MKKIMMLVAIGAIAAYQSNADYMRWMVSSSAVNSAKAFSGISEENAPMAIDGIRSYQYAALVVSDQENPSQHPYLSIALDQTASALKNSYGNVDNAQVLGRNVVEDGAMTVLADLSSLGDNYTSKYFFIELFDANGKLVGYSEALTGSDIAKFTSTVKQAADWSTTSAWGGGSFTAVPEPTGGLMLLLGAGLIGLRRKKFI